jgi:RND family efflux transporter MFP subunit
MKRIPTGRWPRRFRRGALGGGFVLLTVSVTWLWAHEGHAPLPARGVEADVATGRLSVSRAARDALDVGTLPVEEGAVPETVLAPATLVAPWQAHAYASSRLPGRVVKLHVRPGQHVEAGQLLAEVRSAELEDIQLELLNARNELRLAEKYLNQLRGVAERGASAEQALHEARARQRQAQDALDVSRRRWLALGLGADPLERLLDKGKAGLVPALMVKSPVRGTVVHAHEVVGKVVEPAEHLFEVVEHATVWAQLNVLERDLARVAPGRAVELRLTAYPGEVFRGSVRVVGQRLDPRTHFNAVWAEFANPPGREPRLLPGMSGQAHLAGPAPKGPGTTVAEEALLSDGIDHFVLVEESHGRDASHYQRKNVVVGRRSAGRAEVSAAGLYPGDRVVARGGHELAAFFVPGVLRPGPEALRNLGVRVAPVQAQVVEDVVEIEGAVDLPPGRRAGAAAALAGTLESVRVAPGQAVRAGEVVAEVYSPELLTLQLELLREHRAAELAEDTLARLRQAGDSLPRRQRWEAEARSRAARDRVLNLRRKLALAGLTPAEVAEVLDGKVRGALPVRAPAGGTVVAFLRVLGQAVKAQETLFDIHDLSRPWVVGHAAEGEVGRVRVGQKARVRLSAAPGLVLEGSVVRSARVLDPASRTTAVWVEPAGAGQALRHGQLARLALTVARPPPVLAVPRGAVVRGPEPAVFVRRPDGVFERRAVALGRADDREVEVKGGLEAGEAVAVEGAEALAVAQAAVR